MKTFVSHDVGGHQTVATMATICLTARPDPPKSLNLNVFGVRYGGVTVSVRVSVSQLGCFAPLPCPPRDRDDSRCSLILQNNFAAESQWSLSFRYYALRRTRERAFCSCTAMNGSVAYI